MIHVHAKAVKNSRNAAENNMKAALVQNHPVFGDKKKNLEGLLKLIDSQAAELYILPELCLSGYQFTSADETESLADTVDGEFVNAFIAKSKEKSAAIVFGFAEKTEGGLYNSSMMVTPGGHKYLYRKTHLFYKEKFFFRPGDTGFNVFEFRGVKIGLAICFDWFFPESFRALALKGADLIAHSSNLVMPYCQQADFARALENRVYIFTANRIGTESRDGETLTFTGGSVALSPKGEYLATASKDVEEVHVIEIDTALSRNKFINKHNNIFDERRVEFY